MNRTHLFTGAALAALALTAPAAHAQDTPYTSQTAFNAALLPGSYTETFSQGSGKSTSGYTFTSPDLIYSYGVDASPSGEGHPLFLSGTTLATGVATDDMVFTFTTPDVTAVGGNFYITNLTGGVVGGLTNFVKITLNDGSYSNVAIGMKGASTFLGITSTTPIQSLTFHYTTTAQAVDGPPQYFATVDNFTVGLANPLAAAPEPSQFAAFAIGLLGLGALTLKARRRSAA